MNSECFVILVQAVWEAWVSSQKESVVAPLGVYILMQLYVSSIYMCLGLFILCTYIHKYALFIGTLLVLDQSLKLFSILFSIILSRRTDQCFSKSFVLSHVVHRQLIYKYSEVIYGQILKKKNRYVFYFQNLDWKTYQSRLCNDSSCFLLTMSFLLWENSTFHNIGDLMFELCLD